MSEIIMGIAGIVFLVIYLFVLSPHRNNRFDQEIRYVIFYTILFGWCSFLFESIYNYFNVAPGEIFQEETKSMIIGVITYSSILPVVILFSLLQRIHLFKKQGYQKEPLRLWIVVVLCIIAIALMYGIIFFR